MGIYPVISDCMMTKSTKWIKLVKKYMDTLQLNINMIESYNIAKIKTIIKHHDDALWNIDLENKSTLTLYREHKNRIVHILLTSCLKAEWPLLVTDAVNFSKYHV